MTVVHDIALSARERRLARIDSAEPLWFDAVLRPHRSLDKRGFFILMGAVAAVTVIGGVRTLVLGAWPVAGFFVLDAALIYGAFKLSYASARDFEAIQLKRDALVVTRVSWQERVESWVFDPAWVQVAMADADEHHARLTLRERGKQVAVGRFLPPDERAQVGEALTAALARHRAGAPPARTGAGQARPKTSSME